MYILCHYLLQADRLPPRQYNITHIGFFHMIDLLIYILFVNILINDDVRPWVTIIVNLAYCPSFGFDKFLIISPCMCPTDE